MSTIQAFIKRHTLVIYYVMLFVISFGGFTLVVGPGNFRGTHEQVNNTGNAGEGSLIQLSTALTIRSKK